MTRAHVLVCRGPDCISRGAQDVYTEVASQVFAQGLSHDVVQTQCGCVAPLCGHGPVICSYPSGVWYAGVTPADVAGIVSDDLGRGEAVEHLVAARLEGGA